MSLHQYTVYVDPTTQNILSIVRDDQTLVTWSDSDFQLWNAAQTVPFVLNTAQTMLKAIKGATTYALWNALGYSATQKDQILWYLAHQHSLQAGL